jgi:hypothetical protein
MRKQGRGTEEKKKGGKWKYKCSYFIKQRSWNEELNVKKEEEEVTKIIKRLLKENEVKENIKSKARRP